jgi:diacylglycerol kinase (ATP)
MLILLNPYCGYGRGLARWEQIEQELASRVGSFTLEIMPDLDRLASNMANWLLAGETTFIAAGGDGTVNLLLNALLKANGLRNGVVLGAIGLGSSNDYHKPIQQRSRIGKDQVPLRVNTRTATACDVIRVDYLDNASLPQTRLCLNNASIGVTAEANDAFNHQPGLTRVLRRVSINAAIAATAARTILRYRNIPCSVTIDGGEAKEVLATNLGIVKNPHFAGSLCYESVVTPNDGLLGIHLCERMSRREALSILARLSSGGFRGAPKTRICRAEHIRVESKQPFALELDGEVVRTRRADFSVLKQAVRCCS